MNILIFSHNAGSSQHGMVFRNYAWAREWVKQGHSVTIVAAGFSHSRSRNPNIRHRVTVEDIDGIEYIWLWGNRYNESGRIGRVLSMGIYTFQCLFLPLPLQKHFDLVIASSPHPFAIYPAYLFARKFSAKLVYDIRDLWPLTLKEIGKFTDRHPFIRLMQMAEDFACKHADLITAVPRHCEPYLRKRGLPPRRFLPIANGISPELMQSAPLPTEHAQLLKRLKDEGYFIIGYAGAIGLVNAMHSLVDALKDTDSHIHAVIIGQGALEEALKKQTELLNLSNRIHFLPPILRSQVTTFLDNIDIAYVGLQRSPLYAMGASLTKLNDYMLSSKPVLYAGDDRENPVEQSNCGLCCEAENTEQIATALTRFAQTPSEELQKMGRNGKEWLLKNHMVAQQVQEILNRLAV